MTTKEGEILDKQIKRTGLVSNLISISITVITAIAVCIVFYVQTNSTLDAHERQINSVTGEIKRIDEKVQNIQVFQGVSEEQIITVQEQITEIKQHQLRIEQKLDIIIDRL